MRLLRILDFLCTTILIPIITPIIFVAQLVLKSPAGNVLIVVSEAALIKNRLIGKKYP